MTISLIAPVEKEAALPKSVYAYEDISSVVAEALSELDGSESVASLESIEELSFVHDDLTIPYAIDTGDLFDHYELTHVSELLSTPRECTEVPQLLLEQSKDKLYHAMLTEIHYTHPIMTTIATPLDKGLLALCAYYKFKYDIDIFVSGRRETIYASMKGLFLDPSVKTWGVIATDHSMLSGAHVTPCICHKKDDGSLQILNLDSVKKAIKTFAYAYHDLVKDTPNLERLTLNTQRQSDRYSCRTDALVILKDALRDLKTKKIDDLKSVFEHAQCAHNPKKFIIKLPFSWAKSCQIASVYEAGIKTLLIGKKGKTIEEYKQRFKALFERRDVYRVYGHDESGGLFIKEMSLSYPKEIDLFLNYKGKKNFFVMENFLKKITKGQSLYLEFLKKCY